MEGASNLVGLDLHLTKERMRDLFRALEEKKRVLELLDRFLEESSRQIGVHIGLGDAHPAMKELALIGISLPLPGGLQARIAVLGPVRMQYEKVVASVLHLGQAFERAQLELFQSCYPKIAVNPESSNPNVSDMQPDTAKTGQGEGYSNHTNTVEDVSGVQLASEVTALTAERDQLLREKSDLQDRTLRLQAEFDNFRKRSERDRADFSQYAGMETLREILPVLDNFDIAIKTETQDKHYSKGIELIHQKMVDSLKKLGLEPIETAGQPFDPHIHQAIEQVPHRRCSR